MPSRFPAFIAISMRRMLDESLPVELRLWRLADTYELSARLSTAMALGLLRTLAGPREPGDFISSHRRLQDDIRQPTLFRWRVLALETSKRSLEFARLPDTPASLREAADGLHRFVLEHLDGELMERRGADLASSSVASIRNRLAHGGGLFRDDEGLRAETDALFRRHAHQLEKASGWWSGVDLLGVAQGTAFHLRGSAPETWPTEPFAGDEGVRGDDGGVLWRLPAGDVPLAPFVRYAAPAAGDRVPAPLVYFRFRGRNAEFNVLAETTHDLRSATYRAHGTHWSDLWLPNEKEVSVGRRRPAFTVGELRGRDDVLSKARTWWKKAQPGDVLVVTGPAGIGKSHFLQTLGDGLEQANENVFCWLDGGPASFAEWEEESRVRCGRSSGTVFVIDDFDRLLQADPGFCQLFAPGAFPGCRFILGVRPDSCPVVREAAGADRCEVVALTRLSGEDIAAMLSDQLGAAAETILSSDAELRRDWFDKVAERSEGLPMYVQLLAEEMLDPVRGPARREEARRGSAQPLPKGLEAYFRQLLSEHALSDAGALLPSIVGTLSASRQPLERHLLQQVLEGRSLLETGDSGRDLLDRSLQKAGSLVQVAEVPGGGETVAPLHEALRRMVAHDDFLPQTVRLARKALARLATSWKEQPDDLRAFLWREGLADLLEPLGPERVVAEAMSFERLLAQLDDLGAEGVDLWLLDSERLAAELRGRGTPSASLEDWIRSVRRGAHLLRREPPGPDDAPKGPRPPRWPKAPRTGGIIVHPRRPRPPQREEPSSEDGRSSPPSLAPDGRRRRALLQIALDRSVEASIREQAEAWLRAHFPKASVAYRVGGRVDSAMQFLVEWDRSSGDAHRGFSVVDNDHLLVWGQGGWKVVHLDAGRTVFRRPEAVQGAVALDARRILTWASGMPARLWDTHTGTDRVVTDAPLVAAVKLDDGSIACLSERSTARLTAAGRSTPAVPLPEDLRAVDARPLRGGKCVVFCDRGEVAVWDGAHASVVHPGFSRDAARVRWAADGAPHPEQITFADLDAPTPSETPEMEFLTFREEWGRVCWWNDSVDGDQIVVHSIGDDGQLLTHGNPGFVPDTFAFNIQASREEALYYPFSTAVALGHGATLFVSDFNAVIVQGDNAIEFPERDEGHSFAVSRDGRVFVCFGNEGTGVAYLASPEDGYEVHAVEAPQHFALGDASFAHWDDDRVIVGADERLSVFDVGSKTWTGTMTISGAVDDGRLLTGNRLLSLSSRRSVFHVWNLGEVLGRGRPWLVHAVALSSGRILVLHSRSGITVCDGAGTSLRSMTESWRGVELCDLGPDGFALRNGKGIRSFTPDGIETAERPETGWQPLDWNRVLPADRQTLVDLAEASWCGVGDVAFCDALPDGTVVGVAADRLLLVRLFGVT